MHVKRAVIAVLVLALSTGAFVFWLHDDKALETQKSILHSQANAVERPSTPSSLPTPVENTVQLDSISQPLADRMPAPTSPPGSEKLEVSDVFGIFLSLTSVSSMDDDQLKFFYGVSDAELQKLRDFGDATKEATAAFQKAHYTTLCQKRNDLISVEEVGGALNDADLAVMRHQESLAAESRLELGEELFAKIASYAARTPQRATRIDAIKFMKDTGRSPASMIDRLCRSVGM